MSIIALCAKVARMSWDIDENDGPVGDDMRARVVEARNEHDAMKAEIAALKARTEKAEAERVERGAQLDDATAIAHEFDRRLVNAQRDLAAALAACAEMRAALEAEQAFADYSKRWSAANPDSMLPVGWCFGDGTPSGHGESWRLRDVADAKRNAILSRPDLGAGMVLVERAAFQRVRDELHEWMRGDPDYEEVLADLDALLGKAGG